MKDAQVVVVGHEFGVESEGNHYATYLIMAREIDLPETDARLDWFLDRDAELMAHRHDLCILH